MESSNKRRCFFLSGDPSVRGNGDNAQRNIPAAIADVSTGQFVSIVTDSTPLAVEAWGVSNQMTAKALESIGKVGGPRCCKRDSYLAIAAAIDFVAENLHIHMEKNMPVCSRSNQNNQCIGKRCPFAGGKK